jgi:tetratricopeptide (TPR) repeat protein
VGTKKSSKGNVVLFDLDRGKFLYSKEMIKKLEEEYAKDPTNLKGVLILAHAYSDVGEYNRSKKLYEEAKELEDGSEKAIFGLMDVAEKTGDHEEAVRLGRILSELKPPSADRFVKLGKIFGRLGRFLEGIEVFRRAAKIRDFSADDLNEYGNLLSRAGDAKEATKVLERAVKLEPGHGFAWYNLGVCQRKLGNREACQKSLEKAGASISQESSQTSAREPEDLVEHGIMYVGTRRTLRSRAASREGLDNRPKLRTSQATPGAGSQGVRGINGAGQIAIRSGVNLA